jgi:hypothetical protein
MKLDINQTLLCAAVTISEWQDVIIRNKLERMSKKMAGTNLGYYSGIYWRHCRIL